MEENVRQASAIFIQRHAKKDEWEKENPIIYPGEIGIESDTGRMKLGGETPKYWNQLPYSDNALQVKIVQLENTVKALQEQYQQLIENLSTK